MNYEEQEYRNSATQNTCNYFKQMKQQMQGVNDISVYYLSKPVLQKLSCLGSECCQWFWLRLGAIL